MKVVVVFISVWRLASHVAKSCPTSAATPMEAPETSSARDHSPNWTKAPIRLNAATSAGPKYGAV